MTVDYFISNTAADIKSQIMVYNLTKLGSHLQHLHQQQLKIKNELHGSD